MFSSFKENFVKVITSRLFVLTLLLLGMSGILIYRIFTLQIVNGETYLNDFQLRIKRERSIASTRGNIYDTNGELLAYNELAYSVTIEDVYESGRNRNSELNTTIHNVLNILKSNGDDVINDFNITLDEDNQYEFTVSDTQLLRFLADIYGYSNINDLKYSEKTATPEDVVNYLASSSRYAIGDYETVDETRTFVPGMGYTRQEVLDIITIRYAMSANSYQKYIPTTIASDVSDESVAIIMENSTTLDGVSISEDTVRRYVDSVYFSAVLGYTGRISSEELTTLQESNPDYISTDMVGKTGIEASMELVLQGTKGSETVYVDNLGKVIESTDYVEPVAGNDIYLTIDKELQKAAYNILEQKIAGILVSKIDNIREYIPTEGAAQSRIRIAIYDVYFALFDNNVIRMSDLASETAGETAKTVYSNFLERRDAVMEELVNELLTKQTIYSRLSTEYKSYESYIVSMLMSSSVGILQESSIDTSDPMYLAWRNDENISLYEYLNYAISMNWIDVSRLNLSSQYMDTQEIYEELVNIITERLMNDTDFSKRVIRYMIKSDRITGRQVCMILSEEGMVDVSDEEYGNLSSGRTSAYQFMIDKISNLQITPAQLALDPCSGSIVITDPNTGDVLALVSYPSYDNNRLANSIEAEYYNQLLNDQSRPMWNYATLQTSAPGSTYKMVTASAALEEGVISTRDTVSCTGTFEKLSPTIYRCWNVSGHGSINVTTAIARSCNFFFYEMGYRLSTVNTAYNSDLGLATLNQYADYFGLSETSGIEISEAEPKMSDLYSVVSAIGQGTNDFTTVGLARYVGTIANSGTCYNLTLLDRRTDSEGGLLEEYNAEIRNVIDFEQSTWDVLHNGMRQVIEGKRYYSDLPIEVAGKTGTAQESTARPTHALFVCYAPFEQPEIAIATRIAFGYSSDYAAETAKDVIMYYFGIVEEEEIINGQADELQSAGVTTD